MIIYDRLGGAHESGASAGGIGTMSLDLVSEHSQRQKVTDTSVARAGLKRRLAQARRKSDERRGQHFLPPTIPLWHWGGREREIGARRTGCPASGWGWRSWLPPAYIYIYVGGQ